MRLNSTLYLDDSVVKEMKAKFEDDKAYVEGAENFIEEIESRLETSTGRRDLEKDIIEYRDYVFVWRLLNGETEWMLFLANLTAAKIGVRNVESIKRVINTEFHSQYLEFVGSDDSNDTVSIIGVSEFKFKNGVVTLRMNNTKQAEAIRNAIK